MDDFLILWFDIDNELIATSISYADLKKGVKRITAVQNDEYLSIVDYGYRKIEDVKRLSRFRFKDDFWTSHLIKWDNKDKLFEKYPELACLIN